ncbi:uncharacterized protein LOC106058603 isoform X2 [Biomphalaria glabrata]|uniref:Uncharacterized protein LOC106058603 isoform X2 n=1 Tax=Biomphalaria glabrata TaxID=6526 RepID=A0A9W2Z1T3_BIOGL|nr:uncharacterized protein LOC106058603 isoform X2 [Biomphalaria glabrata]
MSSKHLQLSPFQKEKLEYYFRFLAPDENENLDKNSINRLMDKILDFTGWDEESPVAREFQEVHEAFFEQLFEKAQEDDGTGQKFLTANDLEIFYKEMVHLDPDQAHEVALKAYDHMTDGGKYTLNEDSYEQLFANFLIGRTPYGPGRYIFGCFEHVVRPFQLIAPAPEEDSDLVMEVRKPISGRRPSRPL